MKKVFWIVLCLINLNIAQAQSTIDKDSIGLQSLFDQLESFMDSSVFEFKLNEDLMSEFEKSFPEFEELNLKWDSLSVKSFDFNQMFEGIENLDLKEEEIESMIEKGMQLFENIDMTELEKLLEGLNLEDMNFDYYFSDPQLIPQEKTDSIPEKSKLLKRI